MTLFDWLWRVLLVAGPLVLVWLAISLIAGPLVGRLISTPDDDEDEGCGG